MKKELEQVEAGLVEAPVLVQLQWGILSKLPEKTLQTKEQVLEHIRESIEGEDMVRIDETDLDPVPFLDLSTERNRAV